MPIMWRIFHLTWCIIFLPILSGKLPPNTMFTRKNVTSAIFTLGDAFGGITAIGVHSATFKTMVDNDDIEYIKDSTGTINIPYYLGKMVIVDDSSPVVPAGGVAEDSTAPKYTTILFGKGAFGFGEGSPKIPVELERKASQGNGGRH